MAIWLLKTEQEKYIFLFIPVNLNAHTTHESLPILKSLKEFSWYHIFFFLNWVSYFEQAVVCIVLFDKKKN